MPDISMCLNEECSRKLECWRYMAIPDSWQSYIEFQNICHEGNQWQWFWNIDGKPVRILEI